MITDGGATTVTTSFSEDSMAPSWIRLFSELKCLNFIDRQESLQHERYQVVSIGLIFQQFENTSCRLVVSRP